MSSSLSAQSIVCSGRLQASFLEEALAMSSLRSIFLLLLRTVAVRVSSFSHRSSCCERRSFLATIPAAMMGPMVLLPSSPAYPVTEDTIPIRDKIRPFHSAAYGREEYTNSIVASRDTNISPKEVYDTIASNFLTETFKAATKKANGDGDYIARALDVGAGAGVSTEVLYRTGYRNIDAIDWSKTAWDTYVVNDPSGHCPDSVNFYELDDERFLDKWRQSGKQKYDVIIFNFAINESKAVLFAKELLNTDYGRLLAPINTSNDYWLKQTYKVLTARGDVIWSATDVGAWEVQFQPDVTQDTCAGIWCAPFNGFQKQKKQ